MLFTEYVLYTSISQPVGLDPGVNIFWGTFSVDHQENFDESKKTLLNPKKKRRWITKKMLMITKKTSVDHQENIGGSPRKHWWITKKNVDDHQENISRSPRKHRWITKKTLVDHQENIS